MKCRAGDLAVVIRSEAGNLGKIVTCVRLATLADFAAEGIPPSQHGPHWVLDRKLAAVIEVGYSDGSVARFRATTKLYPDASLYPLRDPGEQAVDETLLTVRIPEVDTV